MKLDPAVVLDGVVVDAAGKPVEGAEVYVLPPDLAGFLLERPRGARPAPTARSASSRSIPTTPCPSGRAPGRRPPTAWS